MTRLDPLAGHASPLLSSVTADSARDAWATGAAATGSGRSQPLIEHWTGTAWRPVTLPPPVSRAWRRVFPLSTVAASGPSDFWAVSDVIGRYLHYNGRTWSTGLLPGARPSSPLVISALHEFSPADIWAFGGRLLSGGTGATHAPYVAHYNGRRWQQVAAPAGPTAITAVSVLTPADIWAVLGRLPLVTAARTTQANALVHWNGRRWASVPLPAVLAGGTKRLTADAADLTSILARSDTNIWLGGGLPNGHHGLTEMAAHFNGSHWRVVMLPYYRTPVLYALTSLVPDGTGGAWAVANNAGLTRSRLWHLHDGKWHGPVLVPPCEHVCVLPGLALIPGTTSIWAAGAAVRGTSAAGLIAATGRLP